MTREEATVQALQGHIEALNKTIEKQEETIEILKQESRCIPYLMHKEMDIPLLECQKAYDIAIDYLRSQAKVKG